MKIWRLTWPLDGDFALASAIGTWTPGGLCRGCRGSTARLVSPLILEWDAGCDVLGDFTWASVTIPVVTEPVLRALQARFRGFEPGPVEFHQDPRLKRPQRVTRRTKPRIWLPYEGPPLHQLRVTHTVHLDLARSTTELQRHCDVCGKVRYQIPGAEHFESHWDPRRRTLTWSRIPRTPGAGAFVRAADLAGADLFKIHEVSGWTFCTDAVVEFLRAQRYTNVTALEMGDAI